MKKNFKFYAVIWAILLAVWCAVVFLVRPILPGYVIRYDARFWIAWAFILAAFIGNLVCAYFAFRAENRNRMFYRFSVIRVSWSALIAMLIVGSALMLIPDCPAWIAAIACVVVFGFNAIAVVKALWAGDTVGRIDERVKTKTAFIKSLTVDAESILARAKSDAVKTECQKVFEAVRYSDPMSNEALSVIEAKITVKMDEFGAAVSADDAEKVKTLAEELTLRLGDRSKKCKALK